ncbi:MAG: MFS transporter [Dehalococcoidia bacterium]
MVSPLLPVFAEDMGASGIWLGLSFSGFAITQVPLMPVAGRLSDRFGKKLFLWSGLVIYTAAAIGYVWSPGYHELVLFRMLSGVGAAMVIPTAFAYVGELAPLRYEARYMALFNMALIAGFGIGPVLGGVVYDVFGMDAAFGSMAILSLLGSCVVFVFLPKTIGIPVTAFQSGTPEHKAPVSSYGKVLRDDGVRGIITFQMTYGLLFGTVLSFIGIWMTAEIGTTVAQVGIVLAARVLVNGTLAYPFGSLGDHMNRALLATTGMLIVVAGTFSIPWLGSFAALLILFVLMGASESMGLPSINAMAVEKGRDMGMGSVMGISNMAMSLGLVAGSIFGGLIEDFRGIISVFPAAAVLGVAGIVAFNIFMLRSGRLPERVPPGFQPDIERSAPEKPGDTPDG